jgi:dTDP-4-amino-4,6-dideoxygalactose transaminase
MIMSINWVPKKPINECRVKELLEKSIIKNHFCNYGPNVQLLEEIIREKFEIDCTKAVIVVSNGSVALHSLTTSINYYHNKNITWATQSFTFPPSSQGSLSKIKIIDIDNDGGINLECVDDSIEGIIVTNIFGNIVDISKYEKWALENDKFLLFDNAATPFTFYKGKSCCNYGNGCTISFHHTKPFGFGEGGAIIVDKKYETIIRGINNFGIGLTDKYYLSEGNNYKMSDIAAVYIIQYLDNFDQIVKKHKELYKHFKNIINNMNGIKLFPSFHDNDRITASCLCILFDNYNDNISKKLTENGIFNRKYYHPLDNSYKSNEIFKKILCVPCNVDMEITDIDIIAKIITSFEDQNT